MSNPAAGPGAPLRVVAGIDEAGLGPLLGPLTLGVAAFRVSPAPRSIGVEADLWELLSSAVCAERPRDDRLWIADSKAVFQRSAQGLARLETSVLACLAQLDAFGRAPHTAAELLACGPGPFRTAADHLGEHPWYERLPAQLPAAAGTAVVQRQASRLRESLESTKVVLLEAGLRLLPAAALNRSFDATGSKSRTAWDQVALALGALWRDYGEEGVLAWVDRQGARKRYGPLVGELCPGARVEILQETAEDCRYRLSQGARRMELRFTVRAEERALPVALASCLAKYGRELAMGAFNAYFAERDPVLKPTAGYVTDARRWLRDAEPILQAADLPPRCLVRER